MRVEPGAGVCAEPGRERAAVHSDSLSAGQWRSCCAAAPTLTWCLPMAWPPYTWRLEPDTRKACAASGSCYAEEGTPTLGRKESGLSARSPERRGLGVLESTHRCLSTGA